MHFNSIYILNLIRHYSIIFLSQFSFIFTHIFTFSVVLHYFLQFYVSLWDNFPYIRRTLFSMFFSTGFLVTNLLCLPRKRLCFTIFKVYVCWLRIINRQLFSFNTLKILIHCVLTSIISVGKSAVHLFVALGMIVLFPVAAFKISLCLWFHQSYYDLCWCGFLCSAWGA